MKQAYKVKDKKIKIYYEEQNIEGLIKHYIHKKEIYLKAYIRQIAAFEQVQAGALQDSSILEFTINKRKVEIDMLVEFNEKTYKISAPDNFEFYNGDLKFRAVEVIPPRYANEIGD